MSTDTQRILATARRLKVFLCHAEEDSAAVREVYEKLRADGFDPWLKEEELLPGQVPRQKILSVMRKTDVVVVFLSSVSVGQAGYLQKEIKVACEICDEQPDGAIFLVPARVDDCQLPSVLSQWHHVDLFVHGGYDKLRRTLEVRARDSAGRHREEKPRLSLTNSLKRAARFQVPPPKRDFTGRDEELAELHSHVHQQGGAMIYGLRGLGGVGKTELALKLAEEVGDDYPDGHLLVDLRGASEDPMSSADALAHVIRAFEPQTQLPESVAALRQIYLVVLEGRRVLLLLDDAASAEQVEPLLLHPACLTIVTSRYRFALPKLHRQDLDALAPSAARELLQSLAPRLCMEEADELADVLGRLPLALRLAGSAFAERPTLQPEAYVGTLRRGQVLKAVEGALRFNYEHLGEEARKCWRFLAVFPGGFDTAAAAAVWGMETGEAEEVLGGDLYRVSLVECREGRYRLHDLARDFAEARLEAEERSAAEARHANHYVRVLREADRLYLKGGEKVLEGLAFFDPELGNVRAGQAWAAAHAGDDQDAAASAKAYSEAGVYCLTLRLHPHDWITWLEAGRSAAEMLDDQAAEGRHLGNLGLAYAAMGEVERAIEHYEQALVISREIGDRRGEGADLGNLGQAYAALGEVERAIEHHEQALAISREIVDRRGEGSHLGNLGNAYAVLGEVERAIEHYEQALVISREIGDRRNEGISLGNLGQAYAILGEVERAIEHYEQALVISREIGDSRGEGNHSWNLGLEYAKQGDLARAAELMQHCVDYERRIGHKDAEQDAAYVDEIRARLMDGS